MTDTVTNLDQLYRARRNMLDIVEVPELGYLTVDGAGAPADPEFAAAVQALYSVSYDLHFAVKKQFGAAPRVLPLEALWWVDDPAEQDLFAAVCLGQADLARSDRGHWRWRAMIVQPEPVDEPLVTGSLVRVRAKRNVPALDRLRYRRWTEGRCAQILHVGPYADEGRSLVRLHEGMAAAGYRPRGRHHEVYLGDPRRTLPEKLRTILRQPIRLAVDRKG
jgi:hypothetical protein